MRWDRKSVFFAGLVVALGLSAVVGAQAADPSVRCESQKLKESGRYGACRLKVAIKGAKKRSVSDGYAKCERRFASKWLKIEERAGFGICPTEGDSPALDGRLKVDADELAMLLAGRDVAGCGAAEFPVSGEAFAYGSGSDGDVLAGAALSYVDNGDGTITDLVTGLMWEKKDDSGGIHDKENEYTWTADLDRGDMDGTIATVFLATLNDVSGGGASCFAGYCDWRIPNAKELQGIVDYGRRVPAIDPVFHRPATCTGCSDVASPTCSCTSTTASSEYWSSSSAAVNDSEPRDAWQVDFSFGDLDDWNKSSLQQVRAVRGGL